MKSDNIFELNPTDETKVDASTTSNEIITAGDYFSHIATAGSYFGNLQGQIQEQNIDNKPKPSNPKHCFRVIDDVEVQTVTIPLSYKYEMVVQNKDQVGNMTSNDLVDIETNVINHLIEHFCQSNKTRDVLGLSSQQPDYIYYDKGMSIHAFTYLVSFLG